jgi:hypothetical protein
MKGSLNGECNRTVCKNERSLFFNHSTEKHYCAECAKLINEANHYDALRLYGHELCTLVEIKEDFIENSYHGLVHNMSDMELKVLQYGMNNLYPKLPKSKINAVLEDIRTEPKIGRNDKCPCLSGKKYKQCCIDTKS